MRDPAVLAVFAVRITAAEIASIEAGLTAVRPFWPPGRCRGAVVGLQIGDAVVGEALLASVVSVAGGAAWTFGPVTTYLRRLPHAGPGHVVAHAGGPARNPHPCAKLG